VNARRTSTKQSLCGLEAASVPTRESVLGFGAHREEEGWAEAELAPEKGWACQNGGGEQTLCATPTKDPAIQELRLKRLKAVAPEHAELISTEPSSPRGARGKQ
jgi:hypothetical protein